MELVVRYLMTKMNRRFKKIIELQARSLIEIMFITSNSSRAVSSPPREPPDNF